MTDTNWKNYTDESIDFIFAQSDISLKESFKSFREVINKSYIALSIYISILAYCMDKLIHIHRICLCNNISIIYFVMIICLSVCVCLISNNLFPSIMRFPGSEPNKLIDDYFEQFKGDEQIREYKIKKIKDYDIAITENRLQVKKRNKNFKRSMIALIISFVIVFIIFLY